MNSAAGRLVQVLAVNGPMLRAEATTKARLSRSTAGKAVEDLVRLGLVTAGEPLANGPGRPSSQLSIDERRVVTIACEIGERDTTLATVSAGGQLSDRVVIRVETAGVSPHLVVEQVSSHVRERIDRLDAVCVGVGVSIPGIVNRSTGVATLVHPLGWRSFQVRNAFVHALPGLYVTVGQDAFFAALAEFSFGAGKEADRMLLLLAESVGLGGAIIGRASGREPVNHTLQAGHVIVNPEGPRCACGSNGCLELYTDGRAVSEALNVVQPVSATDLRTKLDLGLDLNSRERLSRQVFAPLRTGIVSLVNALGPDRVVLAGLLSLFPEVEDFDLDGLLSDSVVGRIEGVTIVTEQLDDSVLIGAGHDAFAPLFADPVLELGGSNTKSSNYRNDFRF